MDKYEEVPTFADMEEGLTPQEKELKKCIMAELLKRISLDDFLKLDIVGEMGRRLEKDIEERIQREAERILRERR